jgi:polyisoprenoid-binding protein YceI
MKHPILATGLVLAAVGSAQAQSVSYGIDPTHTFANFEIGHMGTSTVRGRFDRKEGLVQFDRTARTGSVDITIDVGSVNTGVEPFNKHLLSEDFFNATKHSRRHASSAASSASAATRSPKWPVR